MPVEGPLDGLRAGGADQKWVLVVNVGSGAPAGGSGCQYFIGNFTGNQFTQDDSSPRSESVSSARPPSDANAIARTPLWADYGPDFYAAVTWSDIPKGDGRRLWLGWMSNWRYANDTPTSPWRSAMSVPRELSLRPTPAGLRLIQQPVAGLGQWRESASRTFRGGSIAAANEWLQAQQNLSPLLDVELSLTSLSDNSSCTAHFRSGPDENTSIVLDGGRRRLALDRTRSGKTDFHREFAARYEAPLALNQGAVTVRFLLDTSSLEVFAQRGETVLTALLFPHAGPRYLSLAATGDAVQVASIKIYTLKTPR
jgi:fructan beta-fructosidase